MQYQAVFFHWVYIPIKLLAVPARPTMPSSKLAQASAAAGIVRSHKSEVN